MRDTPPSTRTQRIPAGWIATLVLVLAGCLNPRPEELPSAGSEPSPPADNENVEVDRTPAPPAPASPGASVDPNEEEPYEPPANSLEPEVDRDGGAATRDAGAPDAGG